jgi:hypothetical protein
MQNKYIAAIMLVALIFGGSLIFINQPQSNTQTQSTNPPPPPAATEATNTTPPAPQNINNNNRITYRITELGKQVKLTRVNVQIVKEQRLNMDVLRLILLYHLESVMVR